MMITVRKAFTGALGGAGMSWSELGVWSKRACWGGLSELSVCSMRGSRGWYKRAFNCARMSKEALECVFLKRLPPSPPIWEGLKRRDFIPRLGYSTTLPPSPPIWEGLKPAGAERQRGHDEQLPPSPPSWEGLKLHDLSGRGGRIQWLPPSPPIWEGLKHTTGKCQLLPRPCLPPSPPIWEGLKHHGRVGLDI